MERVTARVGQQVLDPFCGSGVTLIAAEMTGRQAVGIEQSPRYCDISATRWRSFTGQEPVREEDGAFFYVARQEADAGV